MSFIHKFIEDKETPEPIQWLFRRFVSEFDEKNSIAWNKQVKQTTSEFHRKTLLKQGRCEFDNPPLNLTSEELIVLYNYYYFPMHFQSSYEIYKKLFEEQEEFQNQTFFFHDFGCGTLSSAMAFGASFQKYNLSELTFQEHNSIDVLNNFQFYFQGNAYEGISSLELGCIRYAGSITNFKLPNLINGFWLNDISNTITIFLKSFLQENFYTEPYQHHFFNTASCSDSHFYFGNVADKFYLGNFNYEPIQPFISFCNSQNKSKNEITVILNFSYVLASESIDIENIKSLVSEYEKTGCKLIIVNQNPDLDSLNTKWEELKKSIEFDKEIKGVQPIKHFGNKSKSRYEVLIKKSIYEHNILQHLTTIDEEDDEGFLEYINKSDYFKFKLTKKLISNNNFIETIAIPFENENKLNELYKYGSLTTLCEKNHIEITAIQNKILEISLSSSYFIDQLLKYLEKNTSKSEFILPYLLYFNEFQIMPNVHLMIWEKIFNNIDLFVSFEDMLCNFSDNDDKLSFEISSALSKSECFNLVSDFYKYQIYEKLGKINFAKFAIQNYLKYNFSDYSKTMYTRFMDRNFPNEDISDYIQLISADLSKKNSNELPF
jgi:hypothetical protein